MARFNPSLLSKKQKEQMLEQFFEAMCCLKNRKDVEAICRDLFSEHEMIMFVRRMQVAALLQKGWSVRQIYGRLDASFGLIHGVQAHLLNGGQGYELLLKRLKQRMKYLYETEYQDEPPRRPPYWTMAFWLRL